MDGDKPVEVTVDEAPGPGRDRRLASQGNWLKGRYAHTVGVTKPSQTDRKAAARAKAKAARKSRKKNR